MSDQNTPRGPVRPQVIDLDAEEISTERRPAAPPRMRATPPQGCRSPPPARGTQGRGNRLWILAALILALLAGGWLYRGVLADYFPSNQMAAMQARLDALETNGSGLAAS